MSTIASNSNMYSARKQINNSTFLIKIDINAFKKWKIWENMQYSRKNINMKRLPNAKNTMNWNVLIHKINNFLFTV